MDSSWAPSEQDHLLLSFLETMHPYLEVDLLVLKAGILHCIRCLSLDVSDTVTLSNHFYKTKAPLYKGGCLIVWRALILCHMMGFLQVQVTLCCVIFLQN